MTDCIKSILKFHVTILYMDREMVLSSYFVKKIPSNKPENFVTKFTKPIILLSNNQYQPGLNRIINMSFTWFNINLSYKNQTIAYSINNGSNFINLTFPPGVWKYNVFDSYLKQIIKKDGISLTFNSTTFRVTIVLPTQVRLDLTRSDSNDLIGFDKEILTNGTYIGSRVPNLSQDTDVLNIHCDLINDSLVDGQDTDIIDSFSTSVLQPSNSFTLEPRRITFNPINKTTISSIKMWVTDGKRRLLDLNGADVSYSLILKISE